MAFNQHRRLHVHVGAEMTIDQLNRIYAKANGIVDRNPYGPCPDKCKSGMVMQGQIGGGYGYDFCPTCNGYGYVDQITGKGVQGPEKKKEK